MKTTHSLLIALLLICGAAAILGGGALMMDPSGTKLQLSLQLLEHTPFKNYLVPGLVLFFSIGVLSIVTAILVIMRHPIGSRFSVLQGAVLCGWIVIQVYLLQSINPLHVAFGAVGFTLFFLGYIEADDEPMPHKSDFTR